MPRLFFSLCETSTFRFAATCAYASCEGKWEEISWDQALDKVGAKLVEIREKYGPESVVLWCLSAGNPPSYGLLTDMTHRFGNLIGSTNPIQAQVLDNGLVYDATAGFSDWFVLAKPGSDAALALAMAKRIIDDEAYDREFLTRRSVAPFLVNTQTKKFCRTKDNSYLAWNAEKGEMFAVASGEYFDKDAEGWISYILENSPALVNEDGSQITIDQLRGAKMVRPASLPNTRFNGAGINRPQGQWPNLTMSWQPVWSKKCIDCGPRQAEGKKPFCAECCPTHALLYGDEADAEMDALREQGYEIFCLPTYEQTRENVVYARKATSL